MATPSLTLAIVPQVQVYLAYLAKNPDGKEIQYRTPLETLFGTMALPFMQLRPSCRKTGATALTLTVCPTFLFIRMQGHSLKV